MSRAVESVESDIDVRLLKLPKNDFPMLRVDAWSNSSPESVLFTDEKKKNEERGGKAQVSYATQLKVKGGDTMDEEDFAEFINIVCC
jgi:hypothetical protein